MSSPATTQNLRVCLVIADVDGTLVTQDKILTPRAIEAVKKLHDAGILFGITSGRPPRGMKMLIDPLEITEPIAGFNGGVVVKPDLDPVSKQLLPADVAAEVVRSIVKHRLDIFLYTDRDWFVSNADGPHVAREAWTVKFQPTVVHDFDSLTNNVVKVTGVSDDLKAVARCEKDLQQWSAGRVSAARSQPYYLDVTNPKANKGEVVGMFSRLCNIPPSQIATIGDMPNDVLMFKKSGVSIAMGNASPEVQKSATFVTASNEDEGFAKAMERLLQSAAAQ
ncbi:MAG TPA: Cof-type HAD-IIB family hydrolase [Candidatus Limnocylindrales bacterium]|nr:Cof-type HAD-IIB family hydrolase [Candidatus Limnocylindrales bacterium]